MDVKFEVKKTKSFKDFLNPTSLIALSWTLFQLYIVLIKSFNSQIQRPIHVAFAMALVLSSKPMFKGKKKCQWHDILFIVLTFSSIAYLISIYDRLVSRIPFVDPLSAMDITAGLVFIIMLFEASRRAISLALPIISMVFIAYAFYGGGLPGLFGHHGVNLAEFVETQFFSTSGIFSSPISVSVTMVFYFLLFGAFLELTPAGELFADLANIFTRKSYGGSGKASIIASGLFGMISGSAAANTVSVGTFFYPMMKKSGYNKTFSAAITAIGGTGGQLIPPVMGAAAFLMVEMVGVSYLSIMKAAIIPSFVYVLALYFLVHFEAIKLNIRSVNIDYVCAKQRIKDRIHLLFSIIVLVTLILIGRSLMSSAFWATVSLIALCFVRKGTRIDFYTFVLGLEKAAKSAVIVAMPCSIAGIIIGVIVGTGLGLRLSSIIAHFASGNLLIALILTMFIAILLGMGMPTSAAYIMSAVLLAPCIVEMGVMPIVAHFFVFYFANLSMLTPPVAVASYAAASLDEGLDMWTVGIRAFAMSSVIFLLPFAFVYNPGLLGMGSISAILWGFFTMILSTLAFSIGIIGFSNRSYKTWQRMLFILFAVAIIIPEYISSILGIIGLASILLPAYISQFKIKKRECSDQRFESKKNCS